jgi:hypothetical protein
MRTQDIPNFISLATGIILVGSLTQNTLRLAAGQATEIAITVGLLKLIQLLQVADLILILAKKSQGSPVSCFFQLLGRNVVSLYFVSSDSHPGKLMPMCWAWAVADCLRYLYYLNKENKWLGHLRYNAFIILYPFGVYHEMLVINDYIKLTAETIPDIEIFIIRFVQLAIILGMCSLYVYMLKSRSKYYQVHQAVSPP